MNPTHYKKQKEIRNTQDSLYYTLNLLNTRKDLLSDILEFTNEFELK